MMNGAKPAIYPTNCSFKNCANERRQMSADSASKLPLIRIINALRGQRLAAQTKLFNVSGTKFKHPELMDT